MCFKKIFHRIYPAKTKPDENAALTSMQSQTFIKHIEKLMSYVVEVDRHKYIKANELIQFVGGQPQFLTTARELDAEVMKCLIAYKIVTQMEQWGTCFYTKVQVDFNDKTVHYAFDEKIIPWLEKEFKNDKNIPFLIKAVETVYNNIKK